MNRVETLLTIVDVTGIIRSLVRVDFSFSGFNDYVPNFRRKYIFFHFWQMAHDWDLSEYLLRLVTSSKDTANLFQSKDFSSLTMQDLVHYAIWAMSKMLQYMIVPHLLTLPKNLWITNLRLIFHFLRLFRIFNSI